MNPAQAEILQKAMQEEVKVHNELRKQLEKLAGPRQLYMAQLSENEMVAAVSAAAPAALA
jgi:hypothetical protein